MKFTISYILSRKFIGREWKMSNEEYEQLEFLDNKPPVTMAELEAADLELQKVYYLEQRKAEYPNSEEKAEALFHFQAFNDESKMNDVKAKIAEIDAKYPAPVE